MCPYKYYLKTLILSLGIQKFRHCQNKLQSEYRDLVWFFSMIFQNMSLDSQNMWSGKKLLKVCNLKKGKNSSLKKQHFKCRMMIHL